MSVAFSSRASSTVAYVDAAARSGIDRDGARHESSFARREQRGVAVRQGERGFELAGSVEQVDVQLGELRRATSEAARLRGEVWAVSGW